MNNLVMCLPPQQKTTNELDARRQLAVGATKPQIVGLEVVAQCHIPGHTAFISLFPGNTVYVRSASLTQQWAREKFTVKDDQSTEFIIVPIQEVVAMDGQPAR
jgi:hypothetical protein